MAWFNILKEIFMHGMRSHWLS